MLKTELLELIANGENSGLEFKRDDIRPEQLAKKNSAAMTNFQGGMILLGVEEEMLVGQQCARNRMIMEVLRDYDMLIAWASVLPLMKKMNGRKPEFVAAQDYLKTVLHGRIAS